MTLLFVLLITSNAYGNDPDDYNCDGDTSQFVDIRIFLKDAGLTQSEIDKVLGVSEKKPEPKKPEQDADKKSEQEKRGK